MSAEKPTRYMAKGLRYFSNTLNGKTIVAVVLVIAFMITIFVAVARDTGLKILADQIRQKEAIIAVAGMAALEHEMLEHGSGGQMEHLLSALKPAVNAGLVSDVYLMDTTWTLIFSVSGDTIPQRITKPFLARDFLDSQVSVNSKEQEHKFNYYFAPIINQPQCRECHGSQSAWRGIYGVKMPTEGLDASTAVHRRVMYFAVIVLLLVLAGTIIVVMYILVTRPIGLLHDRAEQLARDLPSGDEAQPQQIPLLPVPRSEDEITFLTQAINSLLERLNQANSNLYNRHVQQLQAADRLASTGEMAASLAHEIKNPLAGIMGAMQVIYDSSDPKDPHHPVMAEILVQLKRIEKIVTDLLNFARPSAPEFTISNLNHLVEKSLVLLEKQTQWRQINITSNLPPEPLNLPVDPKLIKQLLWNITTNAMQAMETNGKLFVSTNRKDKWALITIMDTGPGIDPADREKIFRPFYTTKSKGTGLGLAISHRIVEQHDGKLDLSNGEVTGAIVTISLPLERK